MNSSSQALLSGLIDYAGLFPPAALAMRDAVDVYARHLASPFAQRVNRFIVPAERLEELAAAAPVSAAPWRLSVLLGDAVFAAPRIAAFHTAYAGRFRIDSVETKLAEFGAPPPGCTVAIELPIDCCGALLQRLAGRAGVRAKIRTGGLIADSIPSIDALASFLVSAAALRVPFKATSGLHHAVRGDYPLTYAPSSPHAVMHGFVNLFFAAACAWFGHAEATVSRILAVTAPEEFGFLNGGARACGVSLTAAQIAESRRAFALSFGSCSLDEPQQGLGAMGLR